VLVIVIVIIIVITTIVGVSTRISGGAYCIIRLGRSGNAATSCQTGAASLITPYT
jgi:hypothetical protein